MGETADRAAFEAERVRQEARVEAMPEYPRFGDVLGEQRAERLDEEAERGNLTIDDIMKTK